MLDLTKAWVGVQRRLDGNVKQSGYYPRPYVRIDLEGQITNMTPSQARQLAKALVHAANLIDPPKPRGRS